MPTVWNIPELEVLMENGTPTVRIRDNTINIEGFITNSTRARTCSICRNKIERRKFHFSFRYRTMRNWLKKLNICPTCLGMMIENINNRNFNVFATGGWCGSMRREDLCENMR